jgi:hypothetical protein
MFAATGVVHYGLAFKLTGTPGAFIYVNQLVLHHAGNGNDTSITVQLRKATDLVLQVSTPPPQSTTVECALGTWPATPAWHTLDVAIALDATGAVASGRFDSNATCIEPRTGPLPAITAVGIQAGVLQTVNGANGVVFVDNVIVDDVAIP